ncbi:MAG: putative metal-binding motif-containing protein [Polyangiaceae bacterium]|nr:putative metal-binding motif-containing protein [Polyangiaceae bacterium]MCW5788797.1 putative metal-binding motif-containing protein [Polyangiaceae bacterium]
MALTLGVIPACGGGETESGNKPGLSGGAGGTAGSGGAAGSGGTAGGGSGGWAPACTTGEVMECYSGPAGTADHGSCRQGTATCRAGVFGACEGEVHPAEEICNGLDDDCDGEVDEGCSCTEGNTQPCYSGSSGTQGVGPCKAGIQECQATGDWSACIGEQAPQLETCNGVDDDCNGVIDDVTSVRLYRLDTISVLWTSQALSHAWTGPNAPSPCTPIATVFHAYDFNQLMVFTTSGQLHLREHGSWQPPVPATSRFPGLPAPLDAVWQLPWVWHSAGGGPMRTDVTFGAAPNYARYIYFGNTSPEGPYTGPLTFKVNGPPRPDVRDRWSFERMSPDGPEETLGLMTSSEDGKLYQMGIDLEWHNWPNPRSHPYFAAPGAPDANTCVAAWFDMASQTTQFICD